MAKADEEFKNKLVEIYKAQQDDMKTNLKAIGRSEKRGRAQKYFAEMVKSTKDVSNMKNASYNDYSSAMTELAAHINVVAKAFDLHYTNPLTSLSEIANFFCLPEAFEFFMDPLAPKKHHEFQYDIQLTPDGKLNIASSLDNFAANSVNQDANPTYSKQQEDAVKQVNEIFKEGVNVWLRQKGYTVDPTDNTVKKNGNVLTEAEIQDLNTELKKTERLNSGDLRSFLELKFDVDMNPTPGLSA